VNFKTVYTTVAIVMITIAGLALIKVFDISYPLSITTTSRTSELAVVGEGKVDANPDVAYIDAGIAINNSPSVDEVQQTLADTNNKIIAAMKELDIKTEDIKTSNYSIYPNYVYENNQNRIQGYNGNATISIKVKDVKKASEVITAATSAGANQVNGVRFEIDKPEKYREEARNKAIENAKQQAQKLASTLGIKLGNIVNIVESQPNNYPGPIYAKSLESGAGGGGPDIQPGTQTIQTSVTLYFEKK